MLVINKHTSLKTLAGLVSSALENSGVVAVLSGGAAVSIYTNNKYESMDLDFISSAETHAIENALEPLGFTRVQSSRYFQHADTEFVLEFPAGPLAAGQMLLKEWSHLRTVAGVLQILTPTQIVMDRLAAYFHWDDQQSLDQAVWVANDQSLDMDLLVEWAQLEDSSQKFSTFLKRANLN